MINDGSPVVCVHGLHEESRIELSRVLHDLGPAARFVMVAPLVLQPICGILLKTSGRQMGSPHIVGFQKLVMCGFVRPIRNLDGLPVLPGQVVQRVLHLLLVLRRPRGQQARHVFPGCFGEVHLHDRFLLRRFFRRSVQFRLFHQEPPVCFQSEAAYRRFLPVRSSPPTAPSCGQGIRTECGRHPVQ